MKSSGINITGTLTCSNPVIYKIKINFAATFILLKTTIQSSCINITGILTTTKIDGCAWSYFHFLKRPYFVCLFEYQSSIFSRSLFQKDVSLLEADLVKSADILNVEILKCKRLPMMRTTHDEIGRIVMTISWVIVTNMDNYDILFYLKIGQI